jgi:DNA-binding SARP family transcriptional activator
MSLSVVPPAVAFAVGPRLSLLGGFDLSCCGGRVRLSPSGQRLLAFLALHRHRPVPRALLAERLWAYTDPRHASSSLRSALWRLPRPHDEPLVVTGPTALELAPHVRVDLWETAEQAQALTSDGAPPGADDALRETLGRDLLPEWAEDWLLVDQEAFRQLRLHALEELSTALRSAARYPSALLAALTALRDEPLRETAHRRVIEVHLAEGNAAEALRQYQTYRRLLAEELGLGPSPALRRLVAPLLGRPLDGET